MKIGTFEKNRGIYKISAEIHLRFPKKNSLNGYFILDKLSSDAKNCFPSNLVKSAFEDKTQITDYKVFLEKITECCDLFFLQNEIKDATHKKLIYIDYNSKNHSIYGNTSKGVLFSLNYTIFDTYWNNNILLKAIDSSGHQVVIEFNKPQAFRESNDLHFIEYTPELEECLISICDQLNKAKNKLDSLFKIDYFDKNRDSLDKKLGSLLDKSLLLIEQKE